ncbi:tyrosine-type recombinase/integrase [Leptospira sp. 201903070]|uniref:Tyrosine-type recombinase/integrase n=1 Tax=Leptospira ainlahdjerensis TaxID=2810033 RepID=A0ABS2UEX5_9LEPT|nr:tyrosine-type recombinase/integrase [Leptospira ainlahdjerensis]MBM9578093.1 tyrosine-type recombinase/integrase [Leptospira ainlahdjerensis]
MISDMIVHGYSKKTIKSYTDCVSKLAEFHKISPLAMKPSHIYDFFLHLRKSDLCDSTVLVYYSALLLFFTFVKMKSVMEEIPTPKKKPKVATVLNKTEVADFLKHCSSLKEKTIFTLLYSSGIRIGELERLNIGHIDFERKSILIVEGKGNKQRYALLSDQAAFLLNQYIQSYRPTSCLFFSLTKGRDYRLNIRWIQIRFKEICKVSGILKKASVHSLRHSFATHLLEDGYNIFYIQKLLGHTALNSTLIYLHVSPQYLLQIPSPLGKINSAKMSIFETHAQHGLELQMV